MNERERLEEAITALQNQRATLGDAVVDASITALQEKLAAQASTRRAEQRKLVTVLFADLVDSTGLAVRLDPEDVRAVQTAYFDAVTPIIRSYGGAVEKYIGDAVLAVFGVPQAREDDAERAVRAALAMQQAMYRLNERLAHDPRYRLLDRKVQDLGGDLAARSPNLSLRIGIHSGVVLATLGQGEDDFLVTGDTVNLAARLETVAKPGTVLISQETHYLVADLFNVRALAPVTVKGVRQPMRAYRVLTARPESMRREGLRLGSPQVGRDAEMAALVDTLQQLRKGHGGIVTIVGEAGIGKTRLVVEASQTPAGQAVNWIVGHCHSYGSTIPFHLWMDTLRQAAGAAADITVEDLDRRIRDWIERFCPEDCDEVYPALARLLPLVADGDNVSPHPLHDVGRQSKQAVFRAAEILVGAGSTRLPLVIVCEDLQWADPSSVELLERLAALSNRVSLLLVCLLRPDASEAVFAMVDRLAADYRSRYCRLDLEPLSTPDCETLVAHLLQDLSSPKHATTGGDDATRADTAISAQHGGEIEPGNALSALWRILGRADGNPFFLEEAVHALVNAGQLTPAGTNSSGWRLTAEAAHQVVPESVQAILGARIDSLDASARRVLQLAAVIGRNFSPRVLVAAAPEQQDLARQLQALLRQDFLVERSAADGPEFRFRHALVQEVAYRGLPRGQRRADHRRVAEALERLHDGGQEEQVEMLAWHWRLAGEPARAVPYLVLAGDRARRLGGSREAIDAYGTALSLMHALPEPVAPGAAALHERLGDVHLEHLSEHEQARSHFDAFAAAAESPVDRARGARKLATIDLLQGDLAQAEGHFKDALGQLDGLATLDTEASRVHGGLAYLYFSLGDLDRAVSHIRESTRLARRLDDARGLADAYRIRGIIASRLDKPKLALSYARRCLRLYRRLHDLPQMVQAYNNVADCLRQLGQPQRATQHVAKGLALARRIGDTRDQALLLLTQGEVLLDQGQLDQAMNSLLESLSLARASGAMVRVIQAHLTLGIVCRDDDRAADARQHFESALALCQSARYHRFTPRAHLGLAYLAATENDPATCSYHLEQALEAAGAEPSLVFTREMLWVKGVLALRTQQWADAVAYLEESLATAGPVRPRTRRACAERVLGEAYAMRQWPGDREQAYRHLEAARATYGRVGATTNIASTERLLDALGQQERPIKQPT